MSIATFSSEPVLELKDVYGGYSLNKPVLHDVSFSIYPGELVSLIGLNGAGKSTTMKHILGLLLPHKGIVHIKKKSLADDIEKYRSSYAYVPESPLLYDELTVGEHLELTAMAYNMGKSDYRARADQMLEIFHMGEHAKRFPAHLSKGMRQKVMIMCAFLVKPDLYIIDEPFLGLDPLGIRSVLDLMEEEKKNGASILMSSHILSMIERYSDRFIVLHRGGIAAEGDLKAIQSKAGMPGESLDHVFYALVKE